MIYTIKKGRHRARPLVIGLWWNKTSFRDEIIIDKSCWYDASKLDHINKLFGVGFLPLWKAAFYWWPWLFAILTKNEHHKDSFRWGFRPAAEQELFEIYAYCYVNGQRVSKIVGYAEAGKRYVRELERLPNMYYYYLKSTNGVKILGSAMVPHNCKKKLQFALGFFFGGKPTAPHTMNVQRKKV